MCADVFNVPVISKPVITSYNIVVIDIYSCLSYVLNEWDPWHACGQSGLTGHKWYVLSYVLYGIKKFLFAFAATDKSSQPILNGYKQASW